jgi:hypothetical protein
MDSRELWGWSIRAVVMAWPSAALAIAMGRGSAERFLAMALGVGAYAWGFAYVASLAWTRGTAARRRAWSALECAVWVKAAWVLVGVLLWGLVALGVRSTGLLLLPFGAACVLDQVTGAMAIGLSNHLHGAVGLPPGPVHESFLQTLLATVFQGAFIALGLIPLAIATLPYVVRRERRRAFSNEGRRSL